MSGIATIGNGPMVQRASGIVVSADLEKAADPNTGKVPTSYDADGRRRVVLPTDDQRKIDATIKLLASRGMAAIVVCMSRDDGKEPCGRPLRTEAKGEPDAGYGCQCTRVHFCD